MPGRLPTPVGAWGSISLSASASGSWRARTRIRDQDGRLREVSRWGATRGKAERALREALAERAGPSNGALDGNTRVEVLAARWLASLEDRDLSPGTRRLYGIAVNNYVLPGMGALRLREVSVQTVDRVLQATRAEHGASAAKAARSVLSGMFALAVRYGAMVSNPVRDSSPVTVPRKNARALTAEQVEQVVDGLRSSQRAVDLDLPDLVEFMLATGCRVGEACAVRDENVDLAAGTVRVVASLNRVKGKGMQFQPPKSRAGDRVLLLPPYCVAMLERRRTEARIRPHGIVFPSPRGMLRDPSNTQADMRRVFAEVGFDWVTSHVFRKTVATRLDEAGLSAREVADQLGHAKISVTLDTYLGRKIATTRAADALER